MRTDPVCGMAIDPGQAAAKVDNAAKVRRRVVHAVKC